MLRSIASHFIPRTTLNNSSSKVKNDFLYYKTFKISLIELFIIPFPCFSNVFSKFSKILLGSSINHVRFIRPYQEIFSKIGLCKALDLRIFLDESSLSSCSEISLRIPIGSSSTFIKPLSLLETTIL